MKKILFVSLALIMYLMTVSSAVSEKVSVSDNFIIIEAENETQCQGTLCTYYFTIENTDSVNRKVNIKNYFNGQTPLSLERYGLIEENISINNPYQCNCIQDVDVNGSIINVCQSCDNISSYINSYYGWKTIPSIKYENIIQSNQEQTILIHKNELSQFRIKMYQPLGQINKFDIQTLNWDSTNTTLDPWTNSTFYHINLSYNQYTDYIAGELYTWNLNSTSGNTANSTNTSKLPGALKNMESTDWDSGRFNNGLVFDGVDEFIVVDTSIGTPFTFLAWMKINGNGGIFDIPGGARVGAYAKDGKIYCYTGTGAYIITSTSGANYSDNKWHLIGCSDSGTNLTVWYDGYANTSVVDANGGASGSNHSIGINTSSFFNGSMDDIIFFKKALTPPQMLQIYQNSRIIRFPVSLDGDLTINSSLGYVRITYDNTTILSINDTLISINITNGECYSYTGNIINFSINANYSVEKDLTYSVNYSFMTSCSSSSSASSGGSSSLLLAVKKVQESHVWQAFVYLINNFENPLAYTRFKNELDLMFYNWITPSKLSMPDKPSYYTTEADLKMAGSAFVDNPTFKQFDILLRKTLGWFFTNMDYQVVQ